MGGRGMSAGVKVAGAAAGAAPVSVRLNAVSDGYFATIRHRLVRGREFTRADRTGPPVAIVNEEMARRFWPAGNALGQRIRLEDDEQDREIIGIAGAARYGSFGADVGPYVFLPLSRYPAMLTLLARSEAPPAHTLANIRRIAHELDPTVAAQRGETLREAAALALVPVRVGRLVFGVAGTIALLLASGGLYGLVCYTLQQRVKEIGIRIALGATRRDVFSTLVGGAVRITAIGVVFGAGLALAVTRLLTTLLYGVSPTDIATFTAIAALLIAISTIAGYAAARQGLNTDPMVVLRRE